MIEEQAINSTLFKRIFILLGILSCIGLVGYGISYIINMPELSPDGFVPKSIRLDSKATFGFGNLLAVFVVLYAIAFFPVIILFTTIGYKINPYAIIIASSLICISLILEIVNNLPLVFLPLFPANSELIQTDILLYIKQIETVKYLAFDVFGFTLAYIGLFIYALLFFKKYPLFSYSILASILLFILNVPFLWIEPKVSIVLMVLSILLFACVPLFLVRFSLKNR